MWRPYCWSHLPVPTTTNSSETYAAIYATAENADAVSVYWNAWTHRPFGRRRSNWNCSALLLPATVALSLLPFGCDDYYCCCCDVDVGVHADDGVLWNRGSHSMTRTTDDDGNGDVVVDDAAAAKASQLHHQRRRLRRPSHLCSLPVRAAVNSGGHMTLGWLTFLFRTGCSGCFNDLELCRLVSITVAV